MDAWNIYHKDGSVLCDVDGNQVMFTSLENTDVWMGECSVSITVKNNSPVIFSIGDYVIYRNERYEINYDPGKIKASSKNTYGEGFVYNDIKFNSLSDELVRAEFLDVVLFEGTVNVDGIETPLHYTALPKFSFYVEFIDDLLDRIQANMNEQYGDGVWKIFSTNMERSVVRGCSESDWHNAYGNESKYIAIDSQSITVDNSTCWDALSLVNSKWDITFIVRGRNVYVGINGPKTPHVFKYGKGNGLREIEQTVDSDQNVITRLRAYGSDKNMPQRYYAELGKKCFSNVTKVDKSVSNSIEITTDLPYNSTLFNTPRTYKTSEDSETFTLGWALKVTFDFQTVVTAHIEPTTTQDGYCIVHTELGEPYDTGDELDPVKLQKFIESASVGKKLYFTRGIYKSAFEKEFIEFDSNMPNNMAVNRLMLPGFPDTSLSAFWNTMTDEEKKYVNPTGSNIIFSEDKYRPYLDSPEKENAGLRQYSMYFDNDDKKNGIIEIYPTIEEMVVSGERIDEISVGSSINDDGVFDDGQEVKDFYIKLKKQIDFDLNDVKNDDFSISLKDGMCGGRTFKINECTKESDGSWSLKCARVKDDALELWFPYKDYPIRKGDHFVLTGLELPDSYIRAASIKLLKYSISYLNSNCKTRYAFQLKVDDLFMARQHDLSVSDSSGATKSLYKTLRAGDVMSIRDEDLGIDSDIVIEQLTIKEEEGNIPSYEITLRDDKSVGAITKIQDKIDSIYSAVGAGGTLNESQVESVVAKVAGKLFVTNDWFGRIFNIVDQYGNKQGENEGIAENSSIRAKMSLWSDGGISALGNSASSGGSGGGGGLDEELLWSILGNSGIEQISKSHLADALAGYATEEWVESKGYLTNRDAYTKEEIDAKEWSSNKGTVTSVGITMPTGFSVSGSPITEKGILAIGFATGYSLPTTAKQSNWDTVYNWYSGITGSDTDTIINKWGEIISFLDGIEDTATLSGIVNGINQSITAESNRAKGAEQTLTNNVSANATAISDEVARAKGAENTISSNLTAEIDRSTKKDNELSKSITDEVIRAKDAEQTLTSSISTNTSAINVLKGYFTNGVAKSAVKLQTARKIWGNTFDGTQDVAGDFILPNGKKIVIGGASLSWDADNNAVKIDGSVYATCGLSALGNSDTTGGGGGLMGSIVPYAKAITLTTQNEGEEIASAWSVKMLYDKIENVDVSGQLTSYLTKQEAQALYQPVGNYLTEHQDISGKADRSELSQYLPLSGGKMTGGISWLNESALPNSSSADYLLVIDSFANGGRMKWIATSTLRVSQLTNDAGYVTASIINGYATQSWVSNNYLPLTGGTMTDALIIHATTRYNNFDEGIRIQDSPSNWAGITYGATGATGCSPQSGQVAWFGAKTSEGKFIISPNGSSRETGLTLNNGGDALWRNYIIYHSGNLPAYPTKASWNYDDVYLKLTGGTLTGQNDILSLSSSNENAYIYFKTNVDGSQAYNRASVGYFCGLAFIANEKGYQRIGVNDSGTPQYWTTYYGGSSSVFDLIHTGNISSQSVSNADTVDNLHASSFLRSDTSNTYSNTIIFNTSGYGICVGGIYGYFTNNLIHLYERVNIGYPSGWGGQDAPQYGLSVYGGCSLATNTGSVGIATTSPEAKLDVNGIQQIYERGLDNKAFRDLIILKAQNSNESDGDNWADTYPTFGIGFRRYWTHSDGNPYGETTCAGIYTTVSASWRGGLVFRTKNNETAGGTHDVTALRLAPSGAATFVSTVTATTFVGSLSGNATSASSCSGNAATATKLETARTIWGQSFDGSGNVDGALILNYNNSTTDYDEGIRINAVFDNPLIHFGGSGNSGTGANQWTIGLHNNKTFWSLTYNSWNNHIITSNTSGNVGIGTPSPSYKLHVVGDMATTGRAIVDSLQIGNITITYDAEHKGLKVGGGLYTDSYLSSLGVDASTALSVKKWADSINLTEESDAELATAYSIGNLYRLINSNQESITQSLNQSVSALQGRCTSLEQRVSALENKVNK